MPGGLIERDTEKDVIYVKNFIPKDKRRSGFSATEKNPDVDKNFSDSGFSAGFDEKTDREERKNQFRDGGKIAPRNIDIKNIDNNIKSITLRYGKGYSPELPGESIKMNEKNEGNEGLAAYEAMIKKNIDYDLYMQDLKTGDRELFDSIYRVIFGVVALKRITVRLSSGDMPYEAAKGLFLKIRGEHVLFTMKRLTMEKRDIKAPQSYIRTCLYDAYITLGADFCMNACAIS